MDSAATISLVKGPSEILVSPALGGGIMQFNPLKLASFALIPFSNRIAGGRFSFDGEQIKLPPNFPEADRKNAIHGYGMLARWDIVSRTSHSVILGYDHKPEDWPWHFYAEQELQAQEDGYRHILRLSNRGETAMPAGMGLHPYFPRAGARFDNIFDGYWHVDDNGLPTTWQKQPLSDNLLSDKTIDTLFTGRSGPVTLRWPAHRLTIIPSGNLPHTHIYTPHGTDYFCVEPVSHMTDAINREGLHIIQPGEIWQCHVDFELEKAE